MIPTLPFGRTGHDSSRIIFGAAALGGMRQARADSTIEIVRDAGINHFDTAASYGDSELRLADFLQDHRNDIFLASKTGDRNGSDARASIERSLERMQIDHIDLIQFHNLAQDADWETVMSEGGALEAAIKAQEEGLVKHIGVTGHGTRIAEMHLKSLARFDFASVLLPYNYLQMQEARYRNEFEELYALCQEKGVAMQTIKSIAKRRWREDDESPRFSWYEPHRDDDIIERAVHFVLKREGLFLNTTSDARLLPKIFAAAESFNQGVSDHLDAEVASDNSGDAEPLFIRGQTDDVRV
ncbi:MAG: aldo/keto reductase [Pseudomonadales bacterium]|nr:aldo/keto reductase [Pseudomonadales bacterium]MBO6596099.1 aldo/keto reductase [Pseudomonadales bacterium]MBO6656359.1 aldo/keto reductase [Pseudomonadales bacterium]MBO6822581.1 aldo/keto reductase [Pseudomonadales bacterium]